MLWDIIVKLVDADKLGGWVRAIVAPLLTLLIAQVPFLSAIVTPDMQLAIAAAVSTFVVGVWSQIAKNHAQTPPTV